MPWVVLGVCLQVIGHVVSPLNKEAMFEADTQRDRKVSPNASSFKLSFVKDVDSR